MNWWVWLLVQAAVALLTWWIVHAVRKKKTGAPLRHTAQKEENRELTELKRMRERSLNVPLTEMARPCALDDIIGQTEGIRALRAAICGKNPQHVLLYGPPGVGKTCAARLVLEEAKRRADSPFNDESEFVEVDATCVRFDERAIADPLLGSVHDPIYQGAGSLGGQGVPQPKPGAVTRAHCGVLFLDEIGELHPMQMNKLLKVLEDRAVYFDSAYYSQDNHKIPPHIHDIFQNGMPADFRLIGATTRMPEELPPALRSRCVELYFKPLGQEDLCGVVQGAAKRIDYMISDKAVELAASYAKSGRDAVNILQLAAGAANSEGRLEITPDDICWVASTCKYTRRPGIKIEEKSRAGVCCGLGVSSAGQGAVIEIECSAVRAVKGAGSLSLGGMVEEEEIDARSCRLKRKSTARASVECVMSMFQRRLNMDCRDFDIRFNIPGGAPMDGPSAGIALCVSLMSAVTGQPPLPLMAFTGEITTHGDVRPVGGVREKLEAAISAGARRIIIPKDNWEDSFSSLLAQIIPVSDISQVLNEAFGPNVQESPVNPSALDSKLDIELTHSA